MFCTFKILISNWSRTRKFNRLLRAGKSIAFDFSHNSHALITLYVQFSSSDWSNLTGELMRKIYAASGNLLTDSWSWQSFVSSCDVLNCLFLLGVQNEIQLLSRLFCNSWLVCLLRFLLTNAPLVKVIGNPISDGIVFKNELTHLPLLEAYKEGWKVSSDSGLTWWPSGAASRLVSLSNYCLWCVFFCRFPEIERSLYGLSLYTSSFSCSL